MNLLKRVNLNIFLGVILLSGIVLAIFFNARSRVVNSLKDYKRINAIVIGTDWVDYARHSDTIIFLSYEPRTRFLDILSIPRDTRIKVKGMRYNRINEVFAYSYKKTQDSDISSGKLQDVLEVILSSGSVKLEIPYYVEVNFESFKNVVDALGGIWVRIDEPMHYDDFHGGLHIHFDKGMHFLDGAKALQYIRYRGPAGDSERIFRQQQFVKTLAQRLKNPLLILRLAANIYDILKNINTNFSFWDFLNLAIEAKDLDMKNIRLFQLPGKPRGSYWYVDWERNARIARLINSSETLVDIRKNKLGKDHINKEDIKVEVFNASDYEGLAREATNLLRSEGFDVVYYGNFALKQNKTLVVDRTGNIAMAQLVSDTINHAEVISRLDLSRMVDVSLILGRDCKLRGLEDD